MEKKSQVDSKIIKRAVKTEMVFLKSVQMCVSLIFKRSPHKEKRNSFQTHLSKRD